MISFFLFIMKWWNCNFFFFLVISLSVENFCFSKNYYWWRYETSRKLTAYTNFVSSSVWCHTIVNNMIVFPFCLLKNTLPDKTITAVSFRQTNNFRHLRTIFSFCKIFNRLKNKNKKQFIFNILKRFFCNHKAYATKFNSLVVILYILCTFWCSHIKSQSFTLTYLMNIFLSQKSFIIFEYIIRLSQALWTTTPRGTADRELKI